VTTRQLIDSLFEGPADVVLGHSSDGYVHRIFFTDPTRVEPDYRRYGLATKLYQELKKVLRLQGKKRVGGEVLSQVPLNIRHKVFGKPDMMSDDIDELPDQEVRRRLPVEPPEYEGEEGGYLLNTPKVFVRNKIR